MHILSGDATVACEVLALVIQVRILARQHESASIEGPESVIIYLNDCCRL